MNNAFHFSSEFLDKFPDIYKSAMILMLDRYHKAPNDFQQLQILQDFGNVFALLPIFWERIADLIEILLIERIPLPPLFPFRQILTFSSKKYEPSINLKWKIDHYEWISCAASREWQDFLWEPENLLNFPHKDLEEAFEVCIEQSVRPINKKVLSEYTRFCELYNLFMRDDLSLKEWQLALNEIKDEEVIFGLFEHRLGGKYGCLDKNFWKFFMDFVKDKDEITYLNHYRMYTRLYIEDKQMVEKYRSEIERISKIPMAVAEFWIDTILYELDFGTKKGAIEVLKRVLNSAIPEHNYFIVENPTFSFHYFFEIIQNTNVKVHSKKKDFLKISKKFPISCYFPRDQIAALKKSQNFSIPRTFVYYITQSIKFNHQILQKLFNSCKYFFAVQPTPLCYRLVLGCRNSSKYRGQSLFLNNNDLEFKGLDNLYITNTFDVLSEIPTAYSQTIKRMYKCDSKYGIIDNQNYTVDEFKFVRDNFFPGMNAIGSNVILSNGVMRYYGSDLQHLLFVKNS